MMKKRYKKALDCIDLREESRKRILQNLNEAQKKMDSDPSFRAEPNLLEGDTPDSGKKRQKKSVFQYGIFTIGGICAAGFALFFLFRILTGLKENISAQKNFAPSYDTSDDASYSEALSKPKNFSEKDSYSPSEEEIGSYSPEGNSKMEDSTSGESESDWKSSSESDSGSLDSGYGEYEEYYGGNGYSSSEEYHSYQENPFLSVKDFPLSTFSADVDTASYANIRRMIESGEYVNPDAVRIEEIINYFHYDYPKPKGKEPFSVVSEIMDCPWNTENKLLAIGIQARDIDYDSLPASNLVFLLDVSGSMDEPDKLPLMVQAFSMLTENLRNKDRISIVTYAGSDVVLLDGADGRDEKYIKEILENLMASGGTNGSDGIETAYELAERHFIKGGNNRVILATDGDLNIGLTSEEELTDLISLKKESGIFLSVLGFGTGNIKDNRMEALADNGNGNYYYIDGILEARKVLMEQLAGTLYTIAKDTKFQVEFNPAALKGYRLIGYENRVLEEEDFNNDQIDAGEIGAGHRVTVLYELVPKNSDTDVTATGQSKLKYQQNKEKETEVSYNPDEWLTINIRYKEPDGNRSKLSSFPVGIENYTKKPSDNIRFAACAAEFGMLLKNSQYCGSASYLDIVRELAKIPSVAADEYKDEFQYLVKKVLRIYS